MEENKFYFICKDDNRVSVILGITVFYTAHGWTVASIPKQHYEIFKKYDARFFEIDRDLALGFKNFGDARSKVKVLESDTDPEYFGENLYNYEETNKGEKLVVSVTQNRYDNIIKAMKLFSKILLEEEYNKRYKKLLSDSNELELRTWDRQLSEVDKYSLGEPTPLLTKISTAQGVDVESLISSIKAAKSVHDEKVDNLFVELQSHKARFKSCTTIEELNWLYFEYFNMKGVFSKEYINANSELFTDKGEIAAAAGVGYKF